MADSFKTVTASRPIVGVMQLKRSASLLIGALLTAAAMGVTALAEGPQRLGSGSSPEKRRVAALTTTCLITNDVDRLVKFYREVLLVPATILSRDYAEFRTEVGVLAIFSAAAQERYIPRSTEPGSNRSVILQFEVADPDQEHARLQSVVKNWVKPPTTQPWGTRSIYFRDPDGNLVDLYAWVTAR